MGRLYKTGFPVFNLGSNASGLGFSTNFVPTRDIIPTKLYWYRTGAGPTHKPTNLRLWDGNNNTLLEAANPMGDTGAVGEQEWVIIGGPRLTAGKLYKVSGYYPGGTWYAQTLGAFPQTPDWPCVINNPQRCTTAANTDTIPTSSCDNAAFYGFDLEFEEAPPPLDGGDVDASIENAFVRWQSADADNTRQEHLPWLTHALSVAIQSGVNEAKEMLEDLVAIGIAVKLGDAEATMAAIKETIEDFGIAGDPSHAGLRADIQGAGAPTIADVITAVGGVSGGGATKDTVPFGGAGWALVETTVGAGAFAWAQPADAYTLDVEDAGETWRAQKVLDGVPLIYMRGYAWWLDGELVSHRQELNGLHNLIYRPGPRYPGVLIDVPVDVEWTLKAYHFTPA